MLFRSAVGHNFLFSHDRSSFGRCARGCGGAGHGRAQVRTGEEVTQDPGQRVEVLRASALCATVVSTADSLHRIQGKLTWQSAPTMCLSHPSLPAATLSFAVRSHLRECEMPLRTSAWNSPSASSGSSSISTSSCPGSRGGFGARLSVASSGTSFALVEPSTRDVSEPIRFVRDA